jgi:prophage tail gpP-like protein
MIHAVVNGKAYTDFVDMTINISLSSIANDFSFTASAVHGFPPFKQNDSIVITVDGEKVLTGFIGEINGSETEGSHLITYSGRDKTGDIIDSSINVIDDIVPSETTTLKSIIEKIISHIGSDVKVIDNVNPLPYNTAEDIFAFRVGMNAAEMILKHAAKRQVLLTSDADGNIVMAQSTPVESGAKLLRLQKSDANNIISQSWSLSGNYLFNKYISRSQLDPRTLNFVADSDSADVESQNGVFVDADVRPGRQHVKVEKSSFSSEQLKDRAKWISQLAKAKATKFKCTVKGHSKPNGGVWKINTLVAINSFVANIDRQMLINSISFSQGEGKPTSTELEFVEKDVYTINQSILSQKPSGSLYDVFKSLG